MNGLNLLRRISLFVTLFSASPGVIFGHGAYHDVVADLNARLATTPDDAGLRFRLASAHAEHGEWKACLDEVARVEKLAPGKYQTAYLTGKARAGEGDLDSALADLSAFLAVEPGHRGALVERARVHLKLGQVDAGCADFASALAKPADPELYVEAAEALRRNGRDAEALALAETGSVNTGGDPAVLLCAVEYAVTLDRIDDALRHLEVLKGKWPRPEPWMQRKAEILEASNRKEEARAAWRELHDHLLALPNLERAQPFLAGPLAASRRALGLAAPAAVVSPPVP